jgi:hypothetical protein
MLDITKMIKNLRTATGEGDSNEELPDTDAILYLNKSYWKILSEFDFRAKERTVFFDTVAGTETYALPVLYESVNNIAITNSEGVRVPLIPISRDLFDRAYTADENFRGLPTHYLREQESIRLQPIPDIAYTVHLHYIINLSDLASPTNVTPQIPREWHEIIELGAKYRRFFDLGDTDNGVLFKNLYDKEIATLKPTKAKETQDMGYAGLEVISRGYDG